MTPLCTWGEARPVMASITIDMGPSSGQPLSIAAFGVSRSFLTLLRNLNGFLMMVRGVINDVAGK